MKRPLLLAALTVAVLAMAAHHQALRAGLVYDDAEVIAGNTQLVLTQVDEWLPLLTSGWWQGEGRDLLWRPLTTLTFAAQATTGAGPRGFHAANLALHGLVSALLFLLLVALLCRNAIGQAMPGWQPTCAAAFAALLFAVHPLTSEAVTLVVGRADLLAAAATLATLLWLYRPGGSHTVGGLMGAFGLTLAACLAKENGFSLPLLVLLLAMAPGAAGAGRARVAAWWPAVVTVVGAAGLALALRFLVLGQLMRSGPASLVDNPIAHAGFWAGRLTALQLLGYGAGLAVWPHPLAVDYSFAAVVVPPVDGGRLGLTALGLLAAAGCAWLMRRPLLALWGLGFFLAAQALTANLLLPIGTVFGERLLYLPLCGLAVSGAALLAAGLRAGHARAGKGAVAMMLSVLVVVLALMTLATARREQVYRDDLQLWTRTVEVMPDAARSQYNLGRSLAGRGRHEEAAVAYDRALRLLAPLPEAHGGNLFVQALTNRAATALRLQQPRQALAWLDEARRLAPQTAAIAFNRALALSQLERRQEALAAFRRGASLDPQMARSLADRGAPWSAWLTAAPSPPPPPESAVD